MNRRADGFSAVELLIAMVVGFLLIESAYQLYTTVVKDSGESRHRSNANNYAYTLLRQYQNNTTYVTSPCKTGSAAPTVPASAGLSANAKAAIAISCPYTDTPDLSLISVTITYYTPTEGQVTRAIAVRP